MEIMNIPKYNQYELISMIKENNVNIDYYEHADLKEAIENDYVFNEGLFIKCANLLGIPEDTIFETESISDTSFRGNGLDKDFEKTLKLFGLMVEQSKLRGRINV